MTWSEEDYRWFFDASPEMFCVAGDDGYFQRLNEAWCRNLGWPLHELLARPFLEFVHPDDRTVTLEGIGQLSAEGTTVAFENRCRRSDGSYRWLLWSATRPPGRSLTCAIVRDVTEGKRADQTLRQSEERYALAVSGSAVGLWDWDCRTGALYVSPRFRELAGLPDRPDHDSLERFIARLHPHDSGPVSGALTAHLENQVPYDVECRLRMMQGNYRWVRMRGQATRDSSGRACRMAGSLADIHDRKAAEHEIRQLNESLELRVHERTVQLEAANLELEAFSYTVSHDLRAPLRAIDGFSRILVEEHAAALSGEAREYLDQVRENTVRMGQLVDDLLAFSRLGRRLIARQRIVPSRLVEACLSELRGECQGRRLEIEIGTLPPCRADPSLLKQVWFNLISNALKYTRDRAEARISIGHRDDVGGGRGPAYFISDNGVGFNMRYADKLFGVFQRLHRAEDYEGTGVGLATVQRIVTRHGGQAWAEARPGEGATFFFNLGQGET